MTSIKVNGKYVRLIRSTMKPKVIESSFNPKSSIRSAWSTHVVRGNSPHLIEDANFDVLVHADVRSAESKQEVCRLKRLRIIGTLFYFCLVLIYSYYISIALGSSRPE